MWYINTINNGEKWANYLIGSWLELTMRKCKLDGNKDIHMMIYSLNSNDSNSSSRKNDTNLDTMSAPSWHTFFFQASLEWHEVLLPLALASWAEILYDKAYQPQAIISSYFPMHSLNYNPFPVDSAYRELYIFYLCLFKTASRFMRTVFLTLVVVTFF